MTAILVINKKSEVCNIGGIHYVRKLSLTVVYFDQLSGAEHTRKLVDASGNIQQRHLDFDQRHQGIGGFLKKLMT